MEGVTICVSNQACPSDSFLEKSFLTLFLDSQILESELKMMFCVPSGCEIVAKSCDKSQAISKSVRSVALNSV